MAKNGKKSSGGGNYVVQSKVKELVKKGKMKCSSDVVAKANTVVAEAVNRGIERAKANGRKTLRAADL